MYTVRLILRFNPLFYEMNVLLKYVSTQNCSIAVILMSKAIYIYICVCVCEVNMGVLMFYL